MEISFDVKNQIITRTDGNRVVANSSEYLSVAVTFTDDWNGADKTMNFENGNTTVSIQLVNNAIPTTAHLNLGVGTWKVYCIGIAGIKRITTNKVNLTVVQSGYIGVDGPTPGVYDQLLTIIQSLHTEAASTAVVRSAVEQFVDDNIQDIINGYIGSDEGIQALIETAVQEYLSSEIDANTVNGHTVNSDVPAGAVYTDHIYDDSDARVGWDGTTYASLGEAIRSQITYVLNKIDNDTKYISEDFTLSSGDSKSPDNVNPPSSGVSQSRTFTIDSVTNFQHLRFTWDNQNSANDYGEISASYTFNGVTTSLYSALDKSGIVDIDVSEMTGAKTVTFYVYAKSLSSYSGYVSRSTLNVKEFKLTNS